MSDFLRSIKLTRDFTITLNCSKSYFMRVLAENTQPRGSLAMFDAFRAGPPFRGTVNNDQFKIRQRQSMTGNRSFMITVRGSALQHNEKTIVTIEASGGHVMLAIISVFSLFIVIGVVTTSISTNTFPVSFFAVALLQVAFMSIFPYIMLRRALSNVQREFEKEFYFLVRDFKG